MSNSLKKEKVSEDPFIQEHEEYLEKVSESGVPHWIYDQYYSGLLKHGTPEDLEIDF